MGNNRILIKLWYSIPKLISAARCTKTKSLLVGRAAMVPADTGPGPEPEGEREPLGFRCTCAHTLSGAGVLSESVNNARSVSAPELGIFQGSLFVVGFLVI